MNEKEFIKILQDNKFQLHKVLTNLYHHPKKQISYCFVINKISVLIYRMKYGAIEIQNPPKEVLLKKIDPRSFGLILPKAIKSAQIARPKSSVKKQSQTAQSEFGVWGDEEENYEENN